MKTKEDAKRFLNLMVMLGEMCESEVKESKVNAYWEILKEYPIEDVECGFKNLIQTYKYKTFPMPATIIENITGDPVVVGIRGWERLEAAISTYGVYESPVITDKALYHTIQRFGGWIKVCLKNRELDDVGFQIFQRDFMRCYQSTAKESGLTEPTALIGLCDRTNAAMGMITSQQEQNQLENNSEEENDLPTL